MTANEFWHSYPKEIKPYFEAHKRRRKMKDEEQYTLYLYVYNALNTVLYNAFKGKGKKEQKPLEGPMLQTYENTNRELTEDEEQAQVALLFSNLGAMQRSFEKSKNEAG